MIYDIVLNGLAQVGKDTFIEYVEKALGSEAYVHNVSSIDPFRDIPKMFGWNGRKDDDYRMCLKLLKEASTYIGDYPNRFLLLTRADVIFNNAKSDNIYIFYHVREPEEIKKLKSLLPELITVLLRGNHIIEQNFPPSDINVLNYQYDITVYNRGSLKDLQKTTKNFIKELISGRK